MKTIQTLVATACLACLAFTAHSSDEPVRATFGGGVVEAEATIPQSLWLSDHPSSSSAKVLAAQPGQPSSDAAKGQARAAAFADGASTMLGLANGLVELNPIMPVSPLGIAMVTAGKMGLANWADTLPEAERAETLRTMSATFGGAAVNNLLTLAVGASPIGLIGGLIAGAYFWNDTDAKLQKEAEDKRAYYMAKAQEHHRAVMAAWNASAQAQGVTTRLVAGQDLGTLDGNPATDLRAAVQAGQPVAATKPAQPVQVAHNFTVLTSKPSNNFAPVVAPAAPTPAPEFTPVLDHAPLEAWPADEQPQTVTLPRPIS